MKQFCLQYQIFNFPPIYFTHINYKSFTHNLCYTYFHFTLFLIFKDNWCYKLHQWKLLDHPSFSDWNELLPLLNTKLCFLINIFLRLPFCTISLYICSYAKTSWFVFFFNNTVFCLTWEFLHTYLCWELDWNFINSIYQCDIKTTLILIKDVTRWPNLALCLCPIPVLYHYWHQHLPLLPLCERPTVKSEIFSGLFILKLEFFGYNIN